MKRTTIALLAIGFLAITAVWWLFLVSPRNAAVAEAEDALAAAEVEESGLRTQISILETIKESEVGFLVAINDMETSIPIAPELDTFVEDLTFLADRTGVNLISITSATPLESGSTPGLFEINLSLSVEGEYFEVLGFLYGLEAMERLVRVDILALSPASLDEDTGDTTTDTTTDTTDDGTGDGATDGSTTTTTTTIPTESPEETPRTAVTGLTVTLSAKIFTRSPVVAGTPIVEEAPAPATDETTTDGTTEESG